MPTANAMGKAYCPQCGWNRGEAEKQTRQFLRLLPALVILFDAPLIVWIFMGHAEVPVLGGLGLVAIIPAILVVLVVRGKIRVRAFEALSVQAAAGGPSQEGTTSTAAPGGEIAGPYDKMILVLADLPRPRPVRMSRRGKIIAMVVSTALLASLGIYAATGLAIQRPVGGQYAGPSQFPVYALSIAFIVVVALVMLRTLTRQKFLLAEGEIAIARVTKRWMARNGPNIRYDFTTPLGEHFTRGAADGSQKLSVGMNVPIFYDPQKPRRQLALCASIYEVVLPGEG
jgi:hypothetical protein